jgi:non-ribosomal peptide synthase protein (TIGR01720 family)
LGEAIIAVKEQLRGIPRKGIGYGILKYCAGVQFPEFKRGSLISFNYFGRFDHEMENDLLTYANEFAGEVLDPFNQLVSNISIVSGVYSGRLGFTFVYSKNKYHQRTIETLLASYMGNLRNIINHCNVQSEIDE